MCSMDRIIKQVFKIIPAYEYGNEKTEAVYIFLFHHIRSQRICS